jgi:integrase/recombinase XerD
MSDPAGRGANTGDLASLLQRFFTDKLMRQRQASPHTIAAYGDTFKLLLQFTTQRTGRQPTRLGLADLDAALVGAFLQHLQTDRGNSGSTRNARLAAIHSFFGYAAVHAPQHAAVIQQVLAIPPQRRDRAIVDYLTTPEAEALIDAPDRTTWLGRRDHVLIQFAIHTGLRVSELTATTIGDVYLETGAHVRCTGKGRKQRCTPLTKPAINSLRAWLAERAGSPGDPLFPSARGTALSRDAVAHLIAKHAAAAAAGCPSLAAKNVTPHTLRHSTAMTLLHGGVELSVIALWLGHESTDATQIYLHADMSIKERALARSTPASTGALPRYQPPDALLAFLDKL